MFGGRSGRAAPALCALALAGCSSWWPWSAPAERPRWPADATIYQCEGGRQLVVRYIDGGKAAIVMFPEREFRLDPVPAASGARFSNGRTTLHTRGPEAFLEEGDKRLFDDCKAAGAK